MSNQTAFYVTRKTRKFNPKNAKMNSKNLMGFHFFFSAFRDLLAFFALPTPLSAKAL